MKFYSFDDPLSAIRLIHNLLFWPLKRWPFCHSKLYIWCKLEWHSCFLLTSWWVISVWARTSWAICEVGMGCCCRRIPIFFPEYCKEYRRKKLGMAHNQCLCGKKYCNWGPQYRRICATMISDRLSQSSMLVWLTREIVQVTQMFERAL